MLLGFKKQFVPKILSGTKIHTLREDKGNRWRSGKRIHFATGIRTKKYKEFHRLECISTQRVFMTYKFNDVIEITIDDKYIFGFSERMKFAKNDGFDSWDDFFDWFYPLIQKAPDQKLTLKLIHWTEFKY